jgi:hypothetical protein
VVLHHHRRLVVVFFYSVLFWFSFLSFSFFFVFFFSFLFSLCLFHHSRLERTEIALICFSPYSSSNVVRDSFNWEKTRTTWRENRSCAHTNTHIDRDSLFLVVLLSFVFLVLVAWFCFLSLRISEYGRQTAPTIYIGKFPFCFFFSSSLVCCA